MGLSIPVSSGSRWSKAATAFLRAYYRKYETLWIAEQLKCTYDRVRGKASDLRLRKHPHRDVWLNHQGNKNAFRNFRKTFKGSPDLRRIGRK